MNAIDYNTLIKVYSSLALSLDGNITFLQFEGPSSKFTRYVQENLEQLNSNSEYAIHANQVGSVIAWLCTMVPVQKVLAETISEPALKILNDYMIPVEYSYVIPLIYSSKNFGTVCSLEKSVHTMTREAFINEMTTISYGKSCSIKRPK